MEEVDPWYWLNFRYANDENAQFTLILDGVQEAAARLGSKNVADLRLALVIVDYLTDVVLARRVDRLIALSERGFAWETREKFDSRTRSQLRQGFNRRIALAARPYEARFAYGLGDPILTADDAEVLRVAHAYRNDVYHEDRHPETLATLAATALHSLSRAWSASLPASVASESSANAPLLSRLREMGYKAPEWASAPSALNLNAAARTVVSWLETAAPVDLRAVRRELAADIRARVRWAEAMVEWLSSWQGPGQEHIEPALAWNDFWQRRGDDPELVRLDLERQRALERLLDGSDSRRDELRAAATERDAAYEQRLRDLLDAHKPEISLSLLPGLSKRGRGLLQAKSVAAALGRYRTLDMRLRVFEQSLGDVAVSWDQEVERQSDRARGAAPRIEWTDDEGRVHALFLD